MNEVCTTPVSDTPKTEESPRTTTCPPWCVHDTEAGEGYTTHRSADLGAGVRLQGTTDPNGAVIEANIWCELTSDEITADEAGILSRALLRASNWLKAPKVAAALDAGDPYAASKVFLDEILMQEVLDDRAVRS
jgi:hypothetical protein